MARDESTFRSEIESAINRHSKENASDTPDFILAGYLESCLAAYDAAVIAREQWYNRPVGGGAAISGADTIAVRGEARPLSEFDKPPLQVHPTPIDAHRIDPTMPSVV